MPPIYVVERAHWVPTGAHLPGAPPLFFLVHLLNFRGCDNTFAEVRKRQELSFENTRVMLLPNFPVKNSDM